MFGFLNLNKPSGITSRDAVNKVQRLVRPLKVGHAGTLDPLASGVLVIAIGQATRLIEYVQQQPKTYRGSFLLGRSSTTEDIEGEITELADPPQPSFGEICEAARGFVGEIQQRPPAYSALKVAGRRAYDLARAGQQVELAPRSIAIHSLEVIQCRYPELTLDIECGSGTYVRSLGRDLAESLGTAAIMSSLVRTAIGPFTLSDALDPNSLTSEIVADRLLPPVFALAHMPEIMVSAADIARLANGLAIDASPAEPAEEYAAIDSGGRLIATLAVRASGQLGPTRYFPA